jgi:glycosyltransferase involved in cell wall biosynthesis
MNVLIICEHASARFGGEAILPLHWFRNLTDDGDNVWMLSHSRTSDELSSLLPDHKDRLAFIDNTKFQIYIDAIRSKSRSRIVDILLSYVISLSTQTRQRALARRLVKQHAIDIILEPIPVSPSRPSIMYGLGAPVVIGPMNGGIDFPKAFSHRERALDRLSIPIGRAVASLLQFVLPGKRKAACLLVANNRTAEALPWSVRRRPMRELVENGIDTNRWTPTATARARNAPGQFTFAFVGRLVGWKAVDLLLEAFARLNDHDGLVLELFGDGEERSNLEASAKRLGCDERVIFRGFVDQALLPRALGHCDCLVLPSLRECGGAVILEAMALSLPVIATNWGGPADYLDDSCGILVDPAPRSEFIAALEDAMRRMRSNPELARQMGAKGRERVLHHFTWKRKVKDLKSVLSEVLDLDRRRD